jgi:hypothetical protein
MNRKTKITNNNILKILQGCIKWMESDINNIFYSKYLRDNLKCSMSTFYSRVKDNSKLQESLQMLKDIQEEKLLIKGLEGKNYPFIIFLLSNIQREKYRRTDWSEENKEESTTKEVVFRFNNN